MARRLDRIAPTSSVARLLDRSAAAGALATPATVPAAVAAPPLGRLPPTLVKRELVLSREADERFQTLVDACRQATGTRLTASHVARALIRVVAGAMPSIQQSLDELGPQRLPSNAPAFDQDRARFELRLARAIGRGLSANGPDADVADTPQP